MSITTIITEAVQQFRLTEGKPVIAKRGGKLTWVDDPKGYAITYGKLPSERDTRYTVGKKNGKFTAEVEEDPDWSGNWFYVSADGSLLSATSINDGPPAKALFATKEAAQAACQKHFSKGVQLPELDESVQTRLFPAFQPVDNIYKSFVISSDATKGFEVIGIDTGTHHGWFKSEAAAKQFIDTKFPNSKNLPNHGTDTRSRYSSRG